MAIYRHFATRDEIFNEVLDRLIGRIDLTASGKQWDEELAKLSKAHFITLTQHPWALHHLASSPAPGPRTFMLGERFYALLDDSPLEPMQIFPAFSAIIAMNFGWAGFFAARGVCDDSARLTEDLSRTVENLSGDAFRMSQKLRVDITNYGSHDHYDVALNLLIDSFKG